MTPADPDDPPRALTLVLDAVDMYAARNMSFFLDARSRTLPPRDQDDLFVQVENLIPWINAAAARRPSSGWTDPLRTLPEFGACDSS